MSSLSYVSVTSSTASMTSNNCYILLSGGPTTLTLPSTSSVGDVLQIVCKQSYAASWTIAQNAGQNITYLAADTTTVGVTGTVVPNANCAPIYMICVVANTTWAIIFSNGTYTFT